MIGTALTFDPIFSIWLVVLLWLCGTGFSIYSYAKETKLNTFKKSLLSLSRILAFTILAILLANPTYSYETKTNIKPNWLVLLDQTESVSYEHGSYSGINAYQNSLQSIIDEKPQEVDLTYVAWGDSVRMTSPPNVIAEDATTNLSEALQYVSQQYEQRVNGIILFSDGIFNRGVDPSYEISNIDVPIYTIGLGDTTQVRDIRIQQLDTDPVGYTNTEHRFSVTVAQSGYKDQPAQLRITSEDTGNIIDSHSITFPSQSSSHSISLSVPLDEVGFNTYVIEVSSGKDEWNESNNRRTAVVQVKESEQRLLHIAFDIHPDVKTYRRALQQTAQLDVITRTWLGGSRFAEGDLDIKSDSLQGIIIHGWPQNLPNEVQKPITEWVEKLPVMFVLTPRSAPNTMDDLNRVLPINYRRSLQPLPISIAEDSITNHNIMEGMIPPAQIPVPLYSALRNISLDPDARFLLWPNYNDLTYFDAPILAIREWGNQRAVSINAFNWYRWMQVGDEPAEFVTRLIQNTTDWLLTDPNDDQLTVRPVNPVVLEGEDVRFTALVKNESGQPERNATVSLNIESKDGSQESRTYTMRHQQNGQYTRNAGRWSAGTYQYEATSSTDGNAQANVSGGFRVVPAQLELQQIIRNDRLLTRLSSLTGGSYFPLQSDSTSTLWQTIENRHSLESIQNAEMHSIALRTHWAWFALVVLLLGLEWYYRKQSGLI